LKRFKRGKRKEKKGRGVYRGGEGKKTASFIPGEKWGEGGKKTTPRFVFELEFMGRS